MLDHMKTLKQGGENGRQPRPQWPGCCCRKMSCPNGSRKLHFVQKILLDRIIKYLGPDGIFCAFAQFFAGIGPAHFPDWETGY